MEYDWTVTPVWLSVNSVESSMCYPPTPSCQGLGKLVRKRIQLRLLFLASKCSTGRSHAIVIDCHKNVDSVTAMLLISLRSCIAHSKAWQYLLQYRSFGIFFVDIDTWFLNIISVELIDKWLEKNKGLSYSTCMNIGQRCPVANEVYTFTFYIQQNTQGLYRRFSPYCGFSGWEWQEGCISYIV